MMMLSRTSCRKVCATQLTITITLPEPSAAGSEISAISAKMYAQVIEPTDRVTLSASQVLNRP